MHSYTGPISVSFSHFPQLCPRLLPTRTPWFFQRFLGARARREFALADDWTVTIQVNGHPQLNGFAGTIIIPEGASTDGASVPLPWTVTFLSLGTLRPLGILLIASIVHDYAFQHGTLQYLQNGTRVPKPFCRHEIDLLFREMIRTINKTPFLAYVAWFAVRIGWLGVKYNGRRLTGKPPTGPLTALVALLAAVWLLLTVS